MTNELPEMMSVPEAGKKYFGLSRNAAYRAADSGVIPVVRVGRILRVPVAAMERALQTAIDAAGNASAERLVSDKKMLNRVAG